MDLPAAAGIGAVALALSVGTTYFTTQSDIAVNENNIQHITKQLDKIEKSVNALSIYLREHSDDGE